MSEEQVRTIDSAISALEDYIVYNQAAGRRLIVYLSSFTAALFMSIVFLFTSVQNLDKFIVIIVASLYIVVFGVLMAVYRFHLNEVARAEHYKTGFMRIRIAANNYDNEGFLTEVRQSLTDKAFDYSPSSVLGGKGKQVESPLPGHPSSDLSAMMLSKLLEGFEIKRKQDTDRKS